MKAVSSGMSPASVLAFQASSSALGASGVVAAGREPLQRCEHLRQFRMECLDGLEGPLLCWSTSVGPTQGDGDRVAHRQASLWHRLDLIAAGEASQGGHVPRHVLILAWITALHQLTPERQGFAGSLALAFLQILALV